MWFLILILELKKKLEEFVWKHTQEFYDKNVQKKIEKIKNADQATIDSLVDKWSKAFTQVSTVWWAYLLQIIMKMHKLIIINMFC